MKNVIVTGANGFIGGSLVSKLLEHGVKVVAIDISFTPSGLPDSPDLLKLETSLDDLEHLIAQIPAAEYDAMYHLAWAGVNGPSKADPLAQLKNVQMGITCAKLCKELGVKKLLCAGTVAEQSVHSLPSLISASGGMMYGVAKHASHLMTECYCKNIGLQFVWMQFSNIYGVGNRTGNLVSYTLNELLAGNEATFGPAEQPYDFIYVTDLIEAVYRLGSSETGHSAYFIGSGTPRILKEYLYEIGELSGDRTKVRVGFRPDDGIRYSFPMFDTKALVSDIGEYVTTSFEDGIVKTIEWLKSIN